MKIKCEVYEVEFRSYGYQKGLIFLPEGINVDNIKRNYEYAEDYHSYEKIGEIVTDKEFLSNFTECDVSEDKTKHWYEYLYCVVN